MLNTGTDTIFSIGQKNNTSNAICMDLSPVRFTVSESEINSIQIHYIADFKSIPGAYHSCTELLAAGLKQSGLQLKPYLKTYINFNSKNFTLVPSAFFDELKAREILEFNCGTVGNDLVLVDDINSDIKLIYSIEEGLKSTIDKLFPNHHLKHTSTVLSRLLLQSEELKNENILMFIDHHAVYIIAKKDHKLLLCNQYLANSDEDILYYLLFVLEQFQFNPLDVKISIAGNIEVEHSLIKTLKKYIRQIRFVHGSKLIKRQEINTLPHHYFYTILNRSFCE